jgi:hypothetical protein
MEKQVQDGPERFLAYDIIGTFDTCKSCSIRKARQKNFNKELIGDSIISGDQLYVDIFSIEKIIIGCSKF